MNSIFQLHTYPHEVCENVLTHELPDEV